MTALRTTTVTTLVFLLIASGTALGIAGTDLVLPAVPALPHMLGGTAERAQLVLAAFTGGAAAGLLLFGELGARFDQARVLIWSLIVYAAISALCSTAQTLDMLIALRFVQGAASAAPPVFAPGMIRQLYGDERAIGAIGRLGSIEALAPALAPVAGLWLVHWFEWRATFDAIAVLALALAFANVAMRRHLPHRVARAGVSGYMRLLRHGRFVRLALSHAFTIGALLAIVFAAPTIFVTSLGGSIGDFIMMQMIGIVLFMTAANAAGRLAARFGAAALILGGTALTAVGSLAILAYALAGGSDTRIVTVLFLFVNGGLGLRGPPGFHATIVAAEDDARGAALAVVAILLTAALATAAVAPFIGAGLVAAGTGASVLSVAAVLLLVERRMPLAQGGA